MVYYFCDIFLTITVWQARANDRQKISKKNLFLLLEFHDYIWNWHEKCIKISTKW